jgi:hypothetical protein
MRTVKFPSGDPSGTVSSQARSSDGLTCWYSIFLTQTTFTLLRSTSLSLSFSLFLFILSSSCLSSKALPFESGELAMTLCLLLPLPPLPLPCLGTPQLLFVRQHLRPTLLLSSLYRSHLPSFMLKVTTYLMKPASLSAGIRTLPFLPSFML